jgi:hypothetical protein
MKDIRKCIKFVFKRRRLKENRKEEADNSYLQYM